MSKRPWRPVGVFPAPDDSAVLSDEDWENVEVTFKKHMRHRAPARLREALNDALMTYSAWKQGVQSRPRTRKSRPDHVSMPATPKQVRANLKHANEAAVRLMERLNDLDGNSRSLIAEAHHDGVTQLYDLVEQAFHIIRPAEVLAKEYPETRKGITYYPSREMGFALARAVQHFCGEEKLAATKDGLYHQLLLIRFGVLNKSHEARVDTMREALKYYRKRASEGSLGQARPWEAPEADPSDET